MADAYEKAYCHLIWATTRREAMITSCIEEILYGYIYRKCREKKAFVYALGGMPDHVPLVCSVPVTISVSDFVRLIKGGSSYYVYYVSHYTQRDALRWQRSYAYLTFAKHDLDAVAGYVQGQKKHHAEGKLWSSLEHLPSEN